MSPNSPPRSPARSPGPLPAHHPAALHATTSSTSSSSCASSSSPSVLPPGLLRPATRPPAQPVSGPALSRRAKRQADGPPAEAAAPGKDRKAAGRTGRAQEPGPDAQRQAPLPMHPPRLARPAAYWHHTLRAESADTDLSGQAAHDLALALVDSAPVLTRGEMREYASALVQRFGGAAILPATCTRLVDAVFSRAGERTPSQLASLFEGLACVLGPPLAGHSGAQQLVGALVRALPALTPPHRRELADALRRQVMVHGKSLPGSLLLAQQLGSAAPDMLARMTAGMDAILWTTIGVAGWRCDTNPRPDHGPPFLRGNALEPVATWLNAVTQYAPEALPACVEALAQAMRAHQPAPALASPVMGTQGTCERVADFQSKSMRFLLNVIGQASPAPAADLQLRVFTRLLAALDAATGDATPSLRSDEPLLAALGQLPAAWMPHAAAALLAHRGITAATARSQFQALATRIIEACCPRLMFIPPPRAALNLFTRHEAAIQGSIRALLDRVGDRASLQGHRQALGQALQLATWRAEPRSMSEDLEAAAMGGAARAFAQALGAPQCDARTLRFLLDFALAVPQPPPWQPTPDEKHAPSSASPRAAARQLTFEPHFRRHALRGVLLALGGAQMGEAMMDRVAGMLLAPDRVPLTSSQQVSVGQGWVGSQGGWRMTLQRCADWVAALARAAGDDPDRLEDLARWCWSLFSARLTGTEPERELLDLRYRLQRLEIPPLAKNPATLGLRLATSPVQALELRTNDAAFLDRLTTWVIEALSLKVPAHVESQPWMGPRADSSPAPWRLAWRASASFIAQQFVVLHDLWNVWPQAGLRVAAALAETQAWTQRPHHAGHVGMFPVAHTYLLETLASGLERASSRVLAQRFTAVLQLQDAFLGGAVDTTPGAMVLPERWLHFTPAQCQERLTGELRRLQRTPGQPDALRDMLVMRTVHLRQALEEGGPALGARHGPHPGQRLAALPARMPQLVPTLLRTVIAQPLWREQMKALCSDGAAGTSSELFTRARAWCEELVPRPDTAQMVEALAHTDTRDFQSLAAGVLAGLGVADEPQALEDVAQALAAQVRDHAPGRVISLGFALAAALGQAAGRDIQPDEWLTVVRPLVADPQVEATSLALFVIPLFRSTQPSDPAALRDRLDYEEPWPILEQQHWDALLDSKASPRAQAARELLKLVPRLNRFQQDPMTVLGEPALSPAQRLALGRVLHELAPPDTELQVQALVGAILHSDLAPEDQSAWVLDVIEKVAPWMPVLGLVRLARAHLVDHLLALDAQRAPRDDKAFAAWVDAAVERARQPAIEPVSGARPLAPPEHQRSSASASDTPLAPQQLAALIQLARACKLVIQEVGQRIPWLLGASGSGGERRGARAGLLRLHGIASQEAQALALASRQWPRLQEWADRMARTERSLRLALQTLPPAITQQPAASSVTTNGPVGPLGLEEDDEGDVTMHPRAEGKGS